MKQSLKIGIDVDDVVNNFFPHWVQMYNKKYDTELNYLQVDDYDLRKIFKDNSDWEAFCSVLDDPEFYDTLEVDKLSQVVIEELQEAGAEIFFITGTYPKHVPLKYNWIKKYFPNILDKNILFVPAENKINVLVNIYIEDNPQNLDKYWVPVILLNKNYNIKSEFYSNTNIHRVNGWNDIRQIFVDKYNLLPQTSPKLEAYEKSFGESTFNDSFLNSEKEEENGGLLDTLMNRCNSAEDYANVLNPYFRKTYDAGYNSALGDMAKYMKELDKFEK